MDDLIELTRTAMWTLAHPVRFRIWELLREVPATASQVLAAASAKSARLSQLPPPVAGARGHDRGEPAVAKAAPRAT